MKKCINCETLMSDEMKFCPKCGANNENINQFDNPRQGESKNLEAALRSNSSDDNIDAEKSNINNINPSHKNIKTGTGSIRSTIVKTFRIIYLVTVIFVLLIVVLFVGIGSEASSKDEFIYKAKYICSIFLMFVLPGIIIVFKKIREKVPLFKREKIIFTIIGWIILLFLGSNIYTGIDSLHSESFIVQEEIRNEESRVQRQIAEAERAAREKEEALLAEQLKAEKESKDAENEKNAREAEEEKKVREAQELKKAKDAYEMEAKLESEATQKEYIESCEEYLYTDINRNPEIYEGRRAKFKGKVIQVQEYSNGRMFRIEIDSNDSIIYAEFKKREEGEDRILENDFVEIYGELTGIESYKALLGNTITIPSIEIEYLFLIDVSDDSIMNTSGKIEISIDISTANSIPIKTTEEELYAIGEYSKKEWPDDTKMSDYVYKQQVEAYNYMMNKEDSLIKNYAYQEYTDNDGSDWNMIQFVYDQQYEAYLEFIESADSKIKEYAYGEYTDNGMTDWNMVMFVYEQQTEAYNYINSLDNAPQDLINKYTDGSGYTDWNMVVFEYKQ